MAAVQTCAGRKPIVMGKPNPTIKDVISSYHNLDPARTLMIGDRYDTKYCFHLERHKFNSFVHQVQHRYLTWNALWIFNSPGVDGRLSVA